MKKSKVAFQGELGAYSHIAVNELFENPEIKTWATNITFNFYLF